MAEQQGQQLQGEREVAEVVGAHLQLEAVRGRPARGGIMTPALFMRTSSDVRLPSSSSAQRRTDARSARSSATVRASTAGAASRTCASAAAPRPSSRTASTSSAPAAAERDRRGEPQPVAGPGDDDGPTSHVHAASVAEPRGPAWAAPPGRPRVLAVRITDSAVMVTGAASGLGNATARRFAADGARVVLVDLPGERLDAAVADLSAVGDVVAAPADVTDEDQLAAAVAVAAGRGPLRVAVACAGIAPPTKTFGKRGVAPLDGFVQVVMVNLVGTFNLFRLVAEQMAGNDVVDGDRGVLIGTASVAAFDGQVGQAAYSASKGGVAAMTLPVARDLAEHAVRVMTIAPGDHGHAHARRAARGGPGVPRQAGPAPGPPGPARGVRRPGRAHRGQRPAQRGDHPARRRDPDGPPLEAGRARAALSRR